MLNLIPLKAWLGIGVIIVLLGAGWYVHRLQIKAARMEAAEHALSDYKGAVAAREKQEASDRAAAEQRSKVLSTTLASVNDQLNTLRLNPPKQAVRYVQLPGEECPRLRLDPEWVQQYNGAAEASAVPYPN